MLGLLAVPVVALFRAGRWAGQGAAFHYVSSSPWQLYRNLAGLFEFGQFLPSGLASAQARNPTVNAFLSGVLAVAIASPCTAPFMGASLGLALALQAAFIRPEYFTGECILFRRVGNVVGERQIGRAHV